eukprot:scaffold7470_cov37-Tisochrysis_lutea.AAC.1
MSEQAISAMEYAGPSHPHLDRQLQELTDFRNEMQFLYQSTYNQLQAARAVSARERRKRFALAAENASLRSWNSQLAEELSELNSKLTSTLKADPPAEGDLIPALRCVQPGVHLLNSQGDFTLPSPLNPIIRAIAHAVELCDGLDEAEQRIVQRLIEGLALATATPDLHLNQGHPDDMDESRSNHVDDAAVDATYKLDGQVDCAELQQLQLSCQRLQLKVARLSIDHTQCLLALCAARKQSLRDTECISVLTQNAQEMLRDLSDATSRIASFEAHISSQANLGAELREARRQHAALLHDLEKTQSQMQNAFDAIVPEQERAKAFEARLDGARRAFRRNGERSAQLVAAVHALSEDSRTLQEENVRLQLLARKLGATDIDLRRPRHLENASLLLAEGTHALTEATNVTRRTQAVFEANVDSARSKNSCISDSIENRLIPVNHPQPSRNHEATMSSEPVGTCAVTDQCEDGEPMFALRTLHERLTTIRCSFAEAKRVAMAQGTLR